MRKLLISTLVAVMVLAMASTAFAADAVTKVAFSDISGHKGEWALTVLGALGVYSGENGLGNAVKPDDPITRAQFAKVVVEAFGKGSIARGMAGMVPKFKDANTNWQWAWGYVNCASEGMGLIKGYEDGTFKPSNPVTYAEAVTMLVRAVGGHKEQVPAGLWPYNYIFYALDNGFIGDVEIIPNLPATRGDVARLLYLAMQVDRLDKDGDVIPDTAVLSGRVLRGRLDGYDLGAKSVQLGGPVSLTDTVYLAGAGNLESLLQLNVVAVLKGGKVCAIGRDEAAYTVSGVFKQLTTDTSGNKYYELTNGTKVLVSDEIPGRLNGEAVAFGVGGNPTPAVGDELVITLGSTNSAVYIVATRWYSDDWIWDIQRTSSTNQDTDITIWCGGMPVTYEILPTAPVTVNGLPVSRDALAKWDVVQIAVKGGGGTNELVGVRATRKVVEGTPTQLWTTWPGPVYHAVFGGVEYTTTRSSVGSSLSTSGYYKISLDKDGKLFVIREEEAAATIVLITGYADHGTYARVTYDERGVSKTVTVASASIDPTAVGHIGRIEVNPITGKLDEYVELEPDTEEYTVVVFDPTAKTLLLRDSSNHLHWFTASESAFVVYESLHWMGAGYKYVGLEGLRENGTIKFGYDPDAGEVIYDLLIYYAPVL